MMFLFPATKIGEEDKILEAFLNFEYSQFRTHNYEHEASHSLLRLFCLTNSIFGLDFPLGVLTLVPVLRLMMGHVKMCCNCAEMF